MEPWFFCVCVCWEGGGVVSVSTSHTRDHPCPSSLRKEVKRPQTQTPPSNITSLLDNSIGRKGYKVSLALLVKASKAVEMMMLA